MGYISAIHIKDDVLVWERTEKGRELKIYKAPYNFYIPSEKGGFTSMYGDKLIKIECKNSYEFYNAKNFYIGKGLKLFESDISPELKILSEHYYKKPAPTLNISFFDIEVDFNKKIGFASAQNPYAPINSISIYHTHLKKYIVLTVPPNFAPFNPTQDSYKTGPAPKLFIEQMESIAPFMIEPELEIKFFQTEKDLLIYFLSEINDSDIIVGWNNEGFDTPYIGKRLEKIEQRYFRKLSFKEGQSPSWRTFERYGNKQETLDLSGRISADYMILFKKYEMVERPSYKLESIANEILPELPKLKYEGTLADLYRNNFSFFTRYSLRDTEILHGLEERLGYVDLANQMMHISTGVWKHVSGTLKLVELAIINYCHHEYGNLIVNDLPKHQYTTPAQGAFVLLPQIGLHERIIAIDISSLYPSAIRSINISPETLLGQFNLNIKAAEAIEKLTKDNLVFVFDNGTQVPSEFRGKTITLTATEWRTFLKNHKWAVSGYGTVFNQNKQGIIPKMLTDWFDTRKKFQKLKQEAIDKTQQIYYDKLQYVYKIKLNSAYGAFLNRYFRFFDSRAGESTTGTGRRILLHQCAKVCEALTEQYIMPDIHQLEEDDDGNIRDFWGYSNKWPVLCSDTDSCYFKVPPGPIDKIIELGDFIGEYVNDSFPDFMKQTFLCGPMFDDLIKTGREIVSDKGIFVSKKRYILHLIDKEGKRCDEMKVMGLEVKKTVLPKEISIKLNHFIERFLKGEDWNVIETDIVDYKEQLTTTENIISIGLPKGVQNVELYTNNFRSDPNTRLPGHVAASIYWNLQLKQHTDTESLPIVSGMKIKVFYLRQKNGRFKSIAVPVDIEQVPQWFFDECEIDRTAHITRLVDKPLQNILTAIDKKTPTKQSLYINNMLEF